MTAARRLPLGLAAGCALAQAATLPLLYGRFAQARPLPDYHEALRQEMALLQGVFHLLGTVLLCGLLWALRAAAAAADDEAGAAPARSERRSAGPTLALLLLSAVVWLQWALRGFPGSDSVVLYGGLLGGVAGLILPVLSFVWLARGTLSAAPADAARPEPRRRLLLYGLYAATWIWSLAFALTQFLVGVAA